MTNEQDILLGAINRLEPKLDALTDRVERIESRLEQFGFPGKAEICIVEQQRVAAMERSLSRHSQSIGQTNRLIWVCTGGFIGYLFVGHFNEVLAGVAAIAHAL